ncbi:MAG: PIG-L deacetylase family protein [Mycobacterium sp.]
MSSGNCARFAAVPLATGGTSAATWRSAAPLPTLDLSECRALVIIGAHPDDETLGLGATAAQLAESGVPVRVVSASDGGAAHPGASAADSDLLTHERRSELEVAAGVLGVGDPISLGLPDGHLAEHEDQLAALLTAVLAESGPGTWCAATWSGDGHPDHEAVGRAAAIAAAATAVPFLEYPVWMWHWAQPDDPDVPWDRAFGLDPPAAAIALKEQAAQCFRSQFGAEHGGEPVLPPFVLPRLLAVGEVVFRAVG